MSNNVFGPPPPPPSIFERQQEQYEDVWWYEQEPDAGRRRLAVLLAFVAVGFLVFANLATWLQQDGVRPSQADVVATATFGAAMQDVQTRIRNDFVAVLTKQQLDAATTDAGVDPTIAADVDAAVRAAVSDPSLQSRWNAAVVSGLQQQEALLDGQESTNESVLVQFETTQISATVLSLLEKKNYSLADEDVRPVRKELVADMADFGLSTVDNLEGMTWGPTLRSGERTLLLVSDDNFSASQVSQVVALAIR